jgi:hypothetical protein
MARPVSVFAGLENYTAINQHLVEFVDSPELVVTLNAQTTQVATIQTLAVVHSVRCCCNPSGNADADPYCNPSPGPGPTPILTLNLLCPRLAQPS